ncbi:MAG: DUF3267 domain-containing protein [Anaerolineales bacterium]|nr:DUF3267 domain-containing protein [Anaerolineales bacterium]
MNKTDLSISMNKANIVSIIIALPILFLLSWLYSLRWGFDELMFGFDIFFGNFFLFFIVFILGIIVHELIHGFSWMIAGKKPFSAMKFGFQVSTFTPYAHCKEPMKVNAYRIGAFMPALLMGILPSIVAILIGNGWLIIFGIVFTVSASGDFIILWLIRNVSKDKFVEDHPTQAGCYVLDENVTS